VTFWGNVLAAFFPKMPGVDDMITIFCDFYPFSAKKMAFFSKTNAMITIFAKLALFCVKNANIFAEFFGENILRIITSVTLLSALALLVALLL
jgi:hypothetical protein